MKQLPTPRPFLKWAGGKTQLADELLARMPTVFNVYHEPFVGSGALFFRLYREGKIKYAVISDLNAELIDTYLAVRDHVQEVIALLSQYPYSKEFYYTLREQNPWQLSLPERAARMIYLNKTGYNGLYRVNREGKFNVPFGRYKSPKYFDPENLHAVSKALQGAEILCAPFETVLNRVHEKDWVYFDPPYAPISDTANFTAYQANGFGPDAQRQLRDICIELTRQSVYVMVSNSNAPLIYELYKPPYFCVSEVLATRAINCNGLRRGKITELIITNYPVDRAVQLRLLEENVPYLLLNNAP